MKQMSLLGAKSLSTRSPMAFTRVYNEQSGPMFWFAYKLLDSKQDAEDIVADVFFKLWSNWESLDTVENFEGYLRTMTRNACFDFLRRTKLKARVENELLLIGKADELYNLSVIKAEVIEVLNVEVKKLSPRHIDVFQLSFVEGLKNEEVAEELQVSNQAVRNMKSKILKVLKLSYLAPIAFYFTSLF